MAYNVQLTVLRLLNVAKVKLSAAGLLRESCSPSREVVNHVLQHRGMPLRGGATINGDAIGRLSYRECQLDMKRGIEDAPGTLEVERIWRSCATRWKFSCVHRSVDHGGA
jgi:hypothetical protein